MSCYAKKRKSGAVSKPASSSINEPRAISKYLFILAVIFYMPLRNIEFDGDCGSLNLVTQIILFIVWQ